MKLSLSALGRPTRPAATQRHNSCNWAAGKQVVANDSFRCDAGLQFAPLLTFNFDGSFLESWLAPKGWFRPFAQIAKISTKM
jgi:hypothetical protein